MNQSIVLHLFFYLYIMGSVHCLQATTFQKHINNEDLRDVYTTLHTIKKIHQDIENQHNESSEEDQIIQHDCIVEIMIVLIGTYEKIVGATVTYYLMMNMPIQQNLHQTIAIIIAEDIIKILRILGNQLIHFIFNRHMTIQEKIWYCTWIVGMIVGIKMCIDTIPQSIKPQPEAHVTINNSNESGYLSDKFSNYK